MKVYPNPAVDKISVSFLAPDEWSNTYRIEIYDAKGDIVQSQNNSIIQQGNQLFAIDVQKLPSGVYVIKLVGKNKSILQRLIKK